MLYCVLRLGAVNWVWRGRRPDTPIGLTRRPLVARQALSP